MDLIGLVEQLEKEAETIQASADRLKEINPKALPMIERIEGMSFGFTQAAAKIKEMMNGNELS